MATTLANISIKDSSSWNTYLNLIYPVGSYYISNTKDSPSGRFGGTWSQVTGRVLYGNTSAGNYNAGTHSHVLTSGYAKVALEASIGVNSVTASSAYLTNRHFFESNWNCESTGSSWSTSRAVGLGGSSNTATNGLPARRDVYCWYRTA